MKKLHLYLWETLQVGQGHSQSPLASPSSSRKIVQPPSPFTVARVAPSCPLEDRGEGLSFLGEIQSLTTEGTVALLTLGMKAAWQG